MVDVIATRIILSAALLLAGLVTAFFYGYQLGARRRRGYPHSVLVTHRKQGNQQL